MNEELGFVSDEDARRDFLGRQGGAPIDSGYSDTPTAEMIDAAVRNTFAVVYVKVLALLEVNRELLDRSASDLLEKETLTEVDLEAYRPDLVPEREPDLKVTA